MSMSDPVSMALNTRDRRREEKKSRDQTLHFSALSSRSVLGIPWRALTWSRMMEASADDLSWDRRHRWSFNWSASWVMSDTQWIWISFWRMSSFCSSSSGPGKKLRHFIKRRQSWPRWREFVRFHLLLNSQHTLQSHHGKEGLLIIVTHMHDLS